jgi:hypothetical protein
MQVMKRFAKSFACLYLAVALVVGVVFVALPGRSAAEGGQAFSISPPLIELQGDPGQRLTTSIKFTNVSDEELLIKTQLNDFGPKNETGEPNIIFDDVENADYSLRQWVNSPAPFKIKAHEAKTVEFPITIPNNAEPGGHYAVIRFTGTAPELEESGVALTASIGTLVFLQVSGAIEEKASVEEFFSATAKYVKAKKTFVADSKGAWFKQGPIQFVERIENEGNVHIKPTGTIKVKNIFGRQVTELRINGNPNDPNNVPKSILPQSIRRFEQTLDRKWMFGRYTATVNVAYGQGQQPLQTTMTFWVIPYELILIVLIVGVGLFFLLKWAIRRYNAHIIRKAHGGNHSRKGKK